MPQDDFQRAWNEGATPTGVDPNTGLPPVAVPVIGANDSDEASYVDEWAKDPVAAPPVRTWSDAGARNENNADPAAQYQAAWLDTPAEATPLQDAATAIPAAAAIDPAAGDAAGAGGDEFNVSYEGQTDSSPGVSTVFDKSGKVVGTYGDDLRQRLSNGSTVNASQLQEWGFTAAPPAAAPAAAPAPAPAPAQPAAAPISPANPPLPQNLT